MFIVLEGGEGAGKSTLMTALADHLRAAGRDVVLAREPGGTPAGEQVRALLHDELTPWAETFAFLLARAELVARVLRPALARGAVALCDRFSPSTFAYQGAGRGLAELALRAADAAARDGLWPDLVLYLDVEPAVGLGRKHGEAEAIRTGREGLAFHERVRASYLAQAAAAPPGAWLTLDAGRPPDAVATAAWAAVQGRVGSKERDERPPASS
ncbi:MAG: dTMP kinase [Dehalococcoidia bacterium]|nr:dTMP kinase [Dehalococcoidia bacterium]